MKASVKKMFNIISQRSTFKRALDWILNVLVSHFFKSFSSDGHILLLGHFLLWVDSCHFGNVLNSFTLKAEAVDSELKRVDF